MNFSGFLKSLFNSTKYFSFEDLRKNASTTFNSQLNVVSPVVEENQDLYYEIQAENDYTPKMIEIVERELKCYSEAICEKKRDLFKNYMEKSKDYFHEG